MVRNLQQRRKINSGEWFTVDDGALLQHFNLSRNRSLRTLETTAQSIDVADDIASDFLKTVLSSVTSPALLDVVIVYRETDLRNMPHCSRCDSELVRCLSSRNKRDRNALFKHQFKVFREMHNARDFRLVLCADVFDCMVVDGIEMLERMMKVEEVTGGLDYLLQKPLIISERRTLRTRYIDQNPGWSRWDTISASAL